MSRRAVLAALLGLLILVLPSAAHAQSTWGEIGFVFASDNQIVGLAGRYDARAQTYTAFRYLHKPGAEPWSVSHSAGQGVSQAAFERLQDAAAVSQSAFDVEAGVALGGWYDATSSSARMLLRSVTRQNPSGGFRVATEQGGTSPDATLADWTAMKAAADAGDRAAFDAAATAAWGDWYTNLDPIEADLIYRIQIDFTSAG